MARVLTFAVVLMVLIGAAYGSLAWIKSQRPADADYKLIEVTKGSISEKALAIGQIEPRHKFHVKSKISGIVARCLVDIGDAVEPGDPLFEILPDPTPTELVGVERALEKARAAYDHAKAEYGRYSRLAEQGIVSRDLLEARKESYEQARISLEHAEDSYELLRKGRIVERGEDIDSIIRAPAAGIVLARPVNDGDPVVPLTSYQAGTEMATVADMRDLVFKGTVDEIDVGSLHVGMPARLKVGALPDKVVTGELSRIAPQAIEKEGARLFEVEIELDPAPHLTLRAGYSATVDLIIREKNDVPVIPERLVTYEDDARHATVELAPEIAGEQPEVRPIVTGLSDGLNVEVVSGVEVGDRLVQRPPREIGG